MARWRRTVVVGATMVALSAGPGSGPAGAVQAGGTSSPAPSASATAAPSSDAYEVVMLPVEPEPGTAPRQAELPDADVAAELRLADGVGDDPGPSDEATVLLGDQSARGARGSLGRAPTTMLVDTTALYAEYASVDVLTLGDANAVKDPAAHAIVAIGRGHLQLRSARPDHRPRIAVAYTSRAGAPPRPWIMADRVADVVMSVEGPSLRLVDLGTTAVDVPWDHSRGRYRCTVYRRGADELLATDVEPTAVGVEQWLLVFSPPG